MPLRDIGGCAKCHCETFGISTPLASKCHISGMKLAATFTYKCSSQKHDFNIVFTEIYKIGPGSLLYDVTWKLPCVLSSFACDFRLSQWLAHRKQRTGYRIALVRWPLLTFDGGVEEREEGEEGEVEADEAHVHVHEGAVVAHRLEHVREDDDEREVHELPVRHVHLPSQQYTPDTVKGRRKGTRHSTSPKTLLRCNIPLLRYRAAITLG